jgi:hypothetical protein
MIHSFARRLTSLCLLLLWMISFLGLSLSDKRATPARRWEEGINGLQSAGGSSDGLTLPRRE